MSFIQGNINSTEDLVEAVNAMRGMLTQGGRKAELELELAEVNNKLDKLTGPTAPVMGEDEYAYLGILHALKNNLEERLHKLEDVDTEPDEEDEEEEEPVDSVSNQVPLEEILENINVRVQSEIDDLRDNPWKSLKG